MLPLIVQDLNRVEHVVYHMDQGVVQLFNRESGTLTSCLLSMYHKRYTAVGIMSPEAFLGVLTQKELGTAEELTPPTQIEEAKEEPEAPKPQKKNNE